ncbi:MAG TPA: condensation domain-containing protein, partial [Armatimonadota bacterium]|nr:condensation domain-containing protein [Armatimonadota bacterium]
MAERVHASLPGEGRLLNLYGPSEDTTYSTWCEVSAGVAETPGIGRPLANTVAYVLDGRMELSLPGATGELYLGGEGLARGYLGRPELTAERFVPDPFSGEEGARLYRTGDIVRWRNGGELEYLGRADAQVKVRGFRIELGEVEAALLSHESVRDCAVLAREDVGEGRRLVGYVVGQGEVSVSELRAHLRTRLPEYMVPSAFVELEELPLTPNGKIDRRRLASVEVKAVGNGEDFIAPRTVVEEMMAGIWSGVLGVAAVGMGDNFFDLGGHSLLATQVISRVREALGLEVPLRELFISPTVATFAAAVEGRLRGAEAEGQQTPPLRAVRREGALPLSFAQQRLWFLDRLEPESAFYNIPLAVRLTGTLDVSALAQTFTEVVRRHESLRTAFRAEEGEPVQVIGEPYEITLEVEDLSGLDAAEREAEARRVLTEEGRRPFDLATGRLLRVRLLRLSEEEHVVSLVMHHIISDGWSVGVLVHEVAALYAAYSEERESPLPELEIQYADYAAWQREWLQGEALERELAYWREQLAGAPPVLELPT